MPRRKREVRFDPVGEIRLMAQADGYVLVRRPGCMPFVLRAAEWGKMPKRDPRVGEAYTLITKSAFGTIIDEAAPMTEEMWRLTTAKNATSVNCTMSPGSEEAAFALGTGVGTDPSHLDGEASEKP